MHGEKMKTYEKELPEGYKQVYHIDAASKKTGTIFTIVSFIPMLIMMFIVFSTSRKETLSSFATSEGMLVWLVFAVVMFAYIVLHELVHGIAYKALTKQKLTFGMKWSCAFCGVPNIYVYRTTALIALLAPFVVFSIVFLGLTVYFGMISSVWYIPFGIILGIHLGGCCGDLYMTYLLLFKYKMSTLLMKDTGPEQFLYII